MATVLMNLSAIGGTIYAQNGTYVVPTNGLVSVNTADAAQLLVRGATYVNTELGYQTFTPACRAATVARVVASASLANGTLAIANQPDQPRQCALRWDPGATAITAGNAALTYTANDGTTQVDNMSLVAAASTPTTTNTSKGVVKMTSVIVTGLAGGATPGVQVNDTNSLSLLVPPGFSSFTALKEMIDGADETIGTVASAAASITPTTAPNGTHIFSWAYSTIAGNQS